MILRNFAVIEGGDGSGTTTQLALLKRRFQGAAVPFFATGEPGSGPIGVLIRRALKGEILLGRETIARLFAADRGEHLYARDGVVERCERGELVVSDRYTPSSLVYQGLECGEELPRKLNEDFPHPELLIYLDVPGEVAMERLKTRDEREIYERLDFQIRAARAYRELLPRYEEAGVRVVSLDGTLKTGEVAAKLWTALREMPIMKG
ncbi:MAG: dTMP kinase [Treponema sp.]|jgi:dTMP kinase|nr:dTMP kinase [Treponema sp.]